MTCTQGRWGHLQLTLHIQARLSGRTDAEVNDNGIVWVARGVLCTTLYALLSYQAHSEESVSLTALRALIIQGVQCIIVLDC